MAGEEIRGRLGGESSYKTFAISADPRAIEDYSSYVDHVVGSDGDEDGLLFAAQRDFVRGIVTTGLTE